ncbi:Vesicle transport through interaction with t-SNAREs 1A [Tritrichomonas musculus]|uniref:Vesicle transport through interaction with t-SNAREs 1A n=1 Tax=Tritrichomonas musculus TaxID=1915356 RepID=A0ABR2IIX7_9EUKA
MTDIEFSQYQDHITNLLNEYKSSINEYPNAGYNDRANQLSTIRDKYNQLKRDLSEWNSTSATWPPPLRNKVRECTDQIKAEVERLNVSFNSSVSEIARQDLLGNSIGVSLEQEAAANSLIENANQSKELGMGILDELSRQRGKMGSISTRLTQMNGDLDRTDSVLHEMQCRDRQRKYFLWGVNIFLFITLCVFIYYILK